jgi:hypothetical protein
MKNRIQNTLIAFVFLVACAVCNAAGVAGVDITVKQDTGGKTVKQLKTDAAGNFVVGSLPAGGYTFEFRAKNQPELKKKQVSITVKGAKKSGSLEHVKGEQLVAGAALKLDIAAGANISGQITSGAKMVWIPPMLGSNRPGHWVEEDSAEAKQSATRGDMSRQSVQRMQESASNPAGN